MCIPGGPITEAERRPLWFEKVPVYIWGARIRSLIRKPSSDSVVSYWGEVVVEFSLCFSPFGRTFWLAFTDSENIKPAVIQCSVSLFWSKQTCGGSVCCAAKPPPLVYLFCLPHFSSFFPYHCGPFFISNLLSIFLWLCYCIWLYLFNSQYCLFQFHCPTFHILNLHSFCLLHYSFFIHLF